MLCSVKDMLERAQQDLQTVQNAANTHSINNWRLACQMVDEQCAERKLAGKCFGPDLCKYLPKNIINLGNLNDWIVAQWRQRFGRRKGSCS